MKMLGLVAILCFSSVAWSHPLKDYVERDDGVWSYEELYSHDMEEDGYMVHMLNVTSHKWMDEEFSDHSIWWSYLAVMVPHEVKVTDLGYLLIGLGRNTDEVPDPDLDPFLWFLSGNVANNTGAITGMLYQVPNQPIVFSEDPLQKRRNEAALQGWTWNYFMNMSEPRNPEVLVEFPMTKSVTRAMDTMTDLVKDRYDYDMQKFVVGGPSKRGWANLLAAAVDDRVVAITPMVFTMMNMIPNMKHHYQSLGGWSFAFRGYVNEGVTKYLDLPVAREWTRMVDPYEFRENLTMPKLFVKGSLDEFFMLDDTQFFFDDLLGQNYLWIPENANHILSGAWWDLVEDLISFFLGVHQDMDWPTLKTTLEGDNSTASVTVELSEDPVNVTAWFANSANEERRDWRAVFYNNTINSTDLNDVEWFEDGVESLGGNRYRVTYDAPATGWLGFYIEVLFNGPEEGKYLQVSSQPNVVPQHFAFQPCTGDDCMGPIV